MRVRVDATKGKRQREQRGRFEKEKAFYLRFSVSLPPSAALSIATPRDPL